MSVHFQCHPFGAQAPSDETAPDVYCNSGNTDIRDDPLILIAVGRRDESVDRVRTHVNIGRAHWWLDLKLACIATLRAALSLMDSIGEVIHHHHSQAETLRTTLPYTIISSMPTYNIFPIGSPISPSQLVAYKTLRLTSLQIDPQAFSSSYAREVAFSDDVWRDRIDSRFKQTFVASYASNEQGDVGNAEAGEIGEWVGSAGIVGPSGLLPSVLAPFKEAGMGDHWETYALYGMWVHPEHRGKGVGMQLVKACLEWARTNIDIKFSSENSGAFEKVVVLLVYEDNVVGRTLYSRVGFTDVEGVSAREGERWMLTSV